MTSIAAAFAAVLEPFLVCGSLALAALLLFLVLRRGVDETLFRRRRRIRDRYRAAVDAVLGLDVPASALAALARAPRGHRAVIESMLLKPLGVTTGAVVDQVRQAARALGFISAWEQRLVDRRWWVRADSARALGLVREPRAIAALCARLDDDHEEVRAAAVEALGLIAHPRTIPVLLERLPDQSRHQRARIVEALREFGDVATPALVAHASTHQADAVVVADILGLIGGTAATASLKAWAAGDGVALRRAALRGLGTIGLDDAGVHLAVTGLEDGDVGVRAAAARALSRTRRAETADELARHLDDDWTVAAYCAEALRRLGAAGLAQLQARSSDATYAGDLARQMLWERLQGEPR